MAGVGQRVATATLRLEARGRNSIGWFYEGHDEQGCKELAMSVAAWDGFLNDQSNWPAASRIGNAIAGKMILGHQVEEILYIIRMKLMHVV